MILLQLIVKGKHTDCIWNSSIRVE